MGDTSVALTRRIYATSHKLVFPTPGGCDDGRSERGTPSMWIKVGNPVGKPSGRLMVI